LLALVGGLGELEGSLELLQLGLRVVGPDLLQEGVDPRGRRLSATQAREGEPAAATRLGLHLLARDVFSAVHRCLPKQVYEARQPIRGCFGRSPGRGRYGERFLSTGSA